MKTIYSAAIETSTATSCFIMKIMSLRPDVQERAYQELREVFGDSDRVVTAKDLSKCVSQRGAQRSAGKTSENLLLPAGGRNAVAGPASDVTMTSNVLLLLPSLALRYASRPLLVLTKRDG